METFGKQLSLVDLYNRVKQAPLDQATKQADLALKQAQIGRIPLEDLKLRTDLIVKQNEELRGQARFQMDSLKAIDDAFGKNPELGQAMLSQFSPQAIAKENKKDGTFSVAMPINGVMRSFSIDPNGNAPLDKRIQMATERKSSWDDLGKEYGTVYSNYQAMDKLALKATGPADIGMIFAYNKILDPGSRVTQGEVLTAQNAPNLPEKMRNAYNKALADGGPIFGELGSSTRQNFVDAAKAIVESKKNLYSEQARFTAESISRLKLNPADYLTPYGDITFKGLSQPAPAGGGTTGTTTAAATQAPGNPGPMEAGVMPTAGPVATPTPPPKYDLQSLTRKSLGNLLNKGQ